MVRTILKVLFFKQTVIAEVIALSPELLKRIFWTVTGPSTTVTVLLQSLMVLLQPRKNFIESGSDVSRIHYY